MIEPRQITDALRPRFGSALAEDPKLCAGAAELLRSFAPYKDSFASLQQRMENYLFNALYERLGPGMSVRLDNGASRRFRMSELPDAADDVMGVLFDSLNVYSVSYTALQTYCMASGSRAALRTLYHRYEAFTSPEERQMIARILRDRGDDTPC